MSDTDKPGYWLRQAANALDKAVQLTGDDNTEEIDSMESRCDELAKLYEGGRREMVLVGPHITKWGRPPHSLAGRYLIVRPHSGPDFTCKFAMQYREIGGKIYHCYVPIFPGSILVDNTEEALLEALEKVREV